MNTAQRSPNPTSADFQVLPSLRKFNHGWTRMDTDWKLKSSSLSVSIRVHPWLRTLNFEQLANPKNLLRSVRTFRNFTPRAIRNPKSEITSAHAHFERQARRFLRLRHARPGRNHAPARSGRRARPHRS